MIILALDQTIDSSEDDALYKKAPSTLFFFKAIAPVGLITSKNVNVPLCNVRRNVLLLGKDGTPVFAQIPVDFFSGSGCNIFPGQYSYIFFTILDNLFEIANRMTVHMHRVCLCCVNTKQIIYSAVG